MGVPRHAPRVRGLDAQNGREIACIYAGSVTDNRAVLGPMGILSAGVVAKQRCAPLSFGKSCPTSLAGAWRVGLRSIAAFARAVGGKFHASNRVRIFGRGKLPSARFALQRVPHRPEELSALVASLDDVTAVLRE